MGKTGIQTIKVLLADDHRLVREGLRSSLAPYKFINVVGEAANGREALQKVKLLSPDVVLMDLNMPEMDGIEATKRVRKQFPKTQVIALTMHENREYVFQLIRSGAQGYILKDSSSLELVRAIQHVVKGKSFFSRTITNFLQNPVQARETTQKEIIQKKLSRRENEVLAGVSRGQLNKEIASDLKVSVRTVETFRSRLMKKLNIRTVADLTKYALQKNLYSIFLSILAVQYLTMKSGL